ncbi:MAG: hypothetical protein ACREVG_19330, partial [Burkholderiales bacterium]
MTYRSTDPIGADLTNVDDSARFRTGQEACGFDDVSQKYGTFIYLPGVASTVVGTMVDYDLNAGTTTLSPATAGVGQVAVALAATVATKFGWYQVEGIAAVRAPNAMVVGADVFSLAATPGSV